MDKLNFKIKKGSNLILLPFFVFLLITFLIFFSSCKKNIKNSFFNTNSFKDSEFLIPVGYKFDYNLNRFVGYLSLDKLISFYKINLENLGWDIQDYYSFNNQAIFVCKKINKSFALLIKQDNNKTYIYIFEKKLNIENQDINYKKI